MPRRFVEDSTNTYLTDFHRNVREWVEAHGVPCMDEQEFPPYRVDIYVPAWHAAIEADGPQHQDRAMNQRDTVLLATYRLPVLHVDDALWENKAKLMEALWGFQIRHRLQATKDNRVDAVKHKVPWL